VVGLFAWLQRFDWVVCVTQNGEFDCPLMLQLIPFLCPAFKVPMSDCFVVEAAVIGGCAVCVCVCVCPGQPVPLPGFLGHHVGIPGLLARFHE
jgi:hypothetical protein